MTQVLGGGRSQYPKNIMKILKSIDTQSHLAGGALYSQRFLVSKKAPESVLAKLTEVNNDIINMMTEHSKLYADSNKETIMHMVSKYQTDSEVLKQHLEQFLDYIKNNTPIYYAEYVKIRTAPKPRTAAQKEETRKKTAATRLNRPRTAAQKALTKAKRAATLLGRPRQTFLDVIPEEDELTEEEAAVLLSRILERKEKLLNT